MGFWSGFIIGNLVSGEANESNQSANGGCMMLVIGSIGLYGTGWGLHQMGLLESTMNVFLAMLYPSLWDFYHDIGIGHKGKITLITFFLFSVAVSVSFLILDALKSYKIVRSMRWLFKALEVVFIVNGGLILVRLIYYFIRSLYN
ncbi:hypothetical protein [Pseudalkalibacillus sp. SCS-8]|uniref:hypothetical protein n=1 Tax=Pseudalkalibacillus nanhaiensis TaxID=3115291 RepID=UPI0032DBF17F